MTDPQGSPISQLLRTLGITREDLERRSDQMRQFLTTENAESNAVEANNSVAPPSVDTRPLSKPLSTTASFTRSRSRADSYSFRNSPPPITPVKSEPIEGTPLLRHFDSMEMVIERQRRQNRRGKKERREREREMQANFSVAQAPSTSPSDTSQGALNLDTFMKSRVDTRISPDECQQMIGTAPSQCDTTPAPPITPQRNKYYRDHTNLTTNAHSQPRKEHTSAKTESPTPTRARPSVPPAPIPQPQYFTYPQYLAYARLFPPLALPQAQAGPSVLPMTPQNKRAYTVQREIENSPLPPSSPPPASSPVTTPHRPMINLVSSPGPMGPLPNEEEYDKLPYTLPPGPYSSIKPDLSYAALVGQAILSSPEHRLTLQEIYDWITIVYPYFKRGETTWMNSIRHVLSTTICFRKVPRERSVGRTLWAIWDEDMECFKGGGFRKHLCKDIVNSTASRGEQTSKSRARGKKRADADDTVDTRKVKRSKKDHLSTLPSTSIATSYIPATMSSHPMFPPTRPTLHHQPYYESCIQTQLPADIVFPPLPAGISYGRVHSNAVASSSTVPEQMRAEDDSAESSPSSSLTIESAPPSTTPSLSLPELTPNRSSSSPPLASSELGIVSSSAGDDVCLDDYIMIGEEEEEEEGPPAEAEGAPFVTSFLSPVKYWGESPKAAGKAKVSENFLRPGIKLEFGRALSLSEEDDQRSIARSKAGRSPEVWKTKKLNLPPMPASPTFNRKAPSRLTKFSKPLADKRSIETERPITPTPTTPPRSTRQLPTSSIRTPLSSKGINPAALHSEGDDDDVRGGKELDLNRTPRKRVISSGGPGPGLGPVTPRRLVFPTNQNDSPFCTPVGGGAFSPFRTPGSRSVFDPHDPATLLDEELNRMGANAGDSPIGVYGKGRGTLLYDSPGFSTSPGQYARWW